MIDLPDLYPEEEDIDQTAYCILLTLKTASQPLWRTKLTDRINEKRSADGCFLNREKDVNAQTIGRRVNNLVQRGYLDTSLTHPDSVGRYLRCYRPTRKAEASLQAVSEEMIDQLVVEYTDRCVHTRTLELEEQALEKMAANPVIKLQSGSLDALADQIRSRIDLNIESTVELH